MTYVSEFWEFFEEHSETWTWRCAGESFERGRREAAIGDGQSDFEKEHWVKYMERKAWKPGKKVYIPVQGQRARELGCTPIQNRARID